MAVSLAYENNTDRQHFGRSDASWVHRLFQMNIASASVQYTV